MGRKKEAILFEAFPEIHLENNFSPHHPIISLSNVNTFKRRNTIDQE